MTEVLNVDNVVFTEKEAVMYDEDTLELIESVLIDGYDKYAFRLINEIDCAHTRAAAQRLFSKYVKP